MFISNSSTVFSEITVNILALPCLISSLVATLYSLELGSDFVYVPNIPESVFSETNPITLEESLLAFFSPGFPSLLFVILVTVDEKIVPSVESNLLLVFFSIISCENALWRSALNL